jgi:two-component system, LytTR family, response regulator
MKYRVLIVDDEPMSRRRLRRFLNGMADLQIIAELADGRSAVDCVHASRPDLMFLDIQMPELNGFETLRQIAPGAVPVVVFVTAFDEFALGAFEAQALDYILKPFSEARVKQAVDRARTHLQGRAGFEEIVSRLLKSLPAQRSRNERLLIRENGKVIFLKHSEIRWVEALGDYMKIHAAGESHLLRITMREMEDVLDADRFSRIHRSRLVNIEEVKELRPASNGESIVVLKSGERLIGSRGLLRSLEKRLAG